MMLVTFRKSADIPAPYYSPTLHHHIKAPHQSTTLLHDTTVPTFLHLTKTPHNCTTPLHPTISPQNASCRIMTDCCSAVFYPAVLQLYSTALLQYRSTTLLLQ